MTWEPRYMLGGIEGYENTETSSIIYVVHKKQWNVVMDGAVIAKFADQYTATEYMFSKVRGEMKNEGGEC